LKDRDLVQVGPLTFAVAILSEPTVVAASPAPPAAPSKTRFSPDDVSGDDIDSWLVGAGGGSTADLPTTVYGGETQTISAFQGKAKPAPALPPVPSPAPVQPSIVKEAEPELDEDSEEQELEQEQEQELEQEQQDSEIYDRFDSEEEEEAESEESETSLDDFVDESNPFHAAKKAQVATPVKAAFQDTSDVAHDILRKLMQQRKAAKS
jgi:hypothetical protein